MENIKIYSYDNHTGKDIPSKIGTFPVDVLLGSTLSEIHDAIQDSQLFFVFTHIADSDFIVPSEQDKYILKTVFKFAKRDYSIDVKPESIWYSNKADKNIIISDSVDLGETDLAVLLAMFLNEIKLQRKAEGKIKDVEIYIVRNFRNGKDLFKTPSLDEAARICDKSPCCVVINKKEEVVYKTSYGKVSVPKPLKQGSNKLAGTNSPGVLNFKAQ